MADPIPSPVLAPFVHQPTVVLTTYRRSGEPVATAVNLVVDGDRAYAKTNATSGKVKRIRHTSRVTVAPSDRRGRPTGPALEMTARLVSGADSARAVRLIERKHPFLQGVLIRLSVRMFRHGTAVIELTPTASEGVVGSGPTSTAG